MTKGADDTITIQNLQNQTIELLEQCKTTIKNVNQVLNKHKKQPGIKNDITTDSNDQDTMIGRVVSTETEKDTSTINEPNEDSPDSIIKILNHEIQAVKNMQLRMAIVGTMKAGRFIFIFNTVVSYFIELKKKLNKEKSGNLKLK